jgi:hypothetical protein
MSTVWRQGGAARQCRPFRPGVVLFDLALIVLTVAATALVVWGAARLLPAIPRGLLFLVVGVAYTVVLSALLRRHCYPNSPVWRGTSLSPLDPVPAPWSRKLYVTLLTGAQVGLAMLLAFVVLSRTWRAGGPGRPQTSLLHDLLHPWSLPPLAESPTGGGNDPPRGAPMPVPWWLLPGMGLVLFPLVTLAWCGTLERNTLRARLPVPHQRLVQPDVAWGRILAAFALLLFWLPLFGLVLAALAYLANRRGAGWTLRVSQVCLALSALLHASLGVVYLAEMR